MRMHVGSGSNGQSKEGHTSFSYFSKRKVQKIQFRYL